MDNKERLIDQAKHLFMRLGIRSVSMDDIATNLGISKKTLYQLVSDKDELVECVVQSQIEHMEAETQCSCDQAENAVEEIFKNMQMAAAQYSKINPMVMFDLQKYHFNAFAKFTAHKNSFMLSVISKNLIRGIEEGLYRPDINIDILAKFRLESMMMSFNLDLFPPEKYNTLEVTLILIEHFLYGLTTEKGYKLVESYKKEKKN